MQLFDLSSQRERGQAWSCSMRGALTFCWNIRIQHIWPRRRSSALSWALIRRLCIELILNCLFFDFLLPVIHPVDEMEYLYESLPDSPLLIVVSAELIKCVISLQKIVFSPSDLRPSINSWRVTSSETCVGRPKGLASLPCLRSHLLVCSKRRIQTSSRWLPLLGLAGCYAILAWQIGRWVWSNYWVWLIKNFFRFIIIRLLSLLLLLK